MELIKKGQAEQLLTKISSVNEERDSRSLKQQGPFLNAIKQVFSLMFQSFSLIRTGLEFSHFVPVGQGSG